LKNPILERDFGELAIKGRQARGNLLTKNDVLTITLKQKGSSTLGGRSVWFDKDVLRLNYDGRGELLGEFHTEDKLLVISSKGEYYLTGFEDTNHFEDDLKIIEKFEPEKVWTVALYDANEKYKYLKRFVFEPTNKKLSFIGDNPKSELLFITDTYYPRLQVTFGGGDSFREPMEIDAEEFIGIKRFTAKGKRIHTWEIAKIEELEPLRFPEPEEVVEEDIESEDFSDDSGQISLF
jgi:topoisomerase-4 subunit A